MVVAAVVGLVVSTAVFVVGIMLEASTLMRVTLPFVVLSIIGLTVARRRVPVRWVAIRGDRVTVVATVRNSSNTPVPTQVVAEGPRREVRVVPGSSDTVQLGDEQVTFLRSRAQAVHALGGAG